ncbi:kinase-like domain-containing protein [Haematococcus lacustris]
MVEAHDVTSERGSSKKSRMRDVQYLLKRTPYVAHAILGEGAFGLVVLASINTFRAVKLVARNRQYVHQLRREVKLHWSMNHPHIVRLREVFRAGSSHVGIAMDVCTGGSLLSYLEAHGGSHACSSAQQGPGAGGGGLREAVARWFFQQLVLTLDYCHAKEVVHRDIKLENVLLDLVPGAPLPLVRLADFGLSRRHNAATPCETYVGTPAYLAPELLQLWMEHGSLALAEQGAVHYDGTKVDVWALGVLLYTLLFKCYPFGCLSSGDLEQAALGAPGAGDQGSSTQQASVRRLLAAQVEYPSPPIAGGHPAWVRAGAVQVSAECMAVLGCMLQRDPDSRPSLAEIMTTPWFREALPEGVNGQRSKLI